MDKYIIFGHVYGFAGGHIYTQNKVQCVQNNGWEVYLVTYEKKGPTLATFSEYPVLQIRDLAYLPSLFTKIHRGVIVDSIIRFAEIEPGDHVVIESNSMRFSYWAELVANKIKCKHFAFLLEGYFHLKEDAYNFFKFKLDRRELAGTREESLKQLSNNHFIVNDRNNKCFVAYCVNSLSEEMYDLNISCSDYDLCIGHIGRESKPYVKELVKDIICYASQNGNKKILLVMIGADKNSSISIQFQNAASEINNLTLICTGNIYPIPRSIVERMNVAIGSSGCIKVSLFCKTTTIAYLDDVMKPYGIIGNQITSLPVNRHAATYDLADLIDDIVSNTDRYKNDDVYKDYDYEKYLYYGFSKIKEAFDFIIKDTSHEYYDTASITYLGWKKVIQKIFGTLPFQIYIKYTRRLETDNK